MAVTWASALGWRLDRHHLGDERAVSVEAVVDRLVAIPAWSGDARAAIRMRLAHPDERDELAAAVAAGQVLATYAFRGATHLMTPASAAVHLAVRCAGRQWELASWRSYYGLVPRDWPRLRSVVREALRASPLTQHELAESVARDAAYQHLRPAFEDKSHTFIKPFAWQGDLCFGPSRDGVATFRLLESVPDWPGLCELDEAGPRAVRAYLAGYGPSTRDRIHYWLGQGLSAGRRRLDAWIDGLTDDLITVSVAGTPALCLAEHAEALRSTTASERVVLIPGSDQWILGAGTSDTAVVPAEHRSLATRGANLVLVGGRVHGTWKFIGDEVQVGWLGRPAASPSAVTAAVERARTACRPPATS